MRALRILRTPLIATFRFRLGLTLRLPAAPIDVILADDRRESKRERRRRISAARHTAPADGVPSLASALVK
jgi:hypothetical protein